MAVRARYTQTAANTNVTLTSTKNDRGVIMRAGNLGNTTRWTNLAIAPRVSVTGPTVYNSAKLTNQLGYSGTLQPGDAGFNRWRVSPANSSGDFALMTANKYVVRRLTTVLAGVANTVLRCPASDFTYRKSIHKTESWRTKLMYSVLIAKNFYTIAQLETDNVVRPNVSYTFYYALTTTPNGNLITGQNSAATNPASQANKDIAANPTLAVPGQLVYRTGSKMPKLNVYAAKTQG